MLRPKYPVYVISKGRHDCGLTANFLIKDNCDFRLVVEPQEAELYAGIYGKERLYILPFSNLGLGGIPARNWCWEHAKEAGHKRHWILDDNIYRIHRFYRNKRIPCNANIAFKAAEDFTERYENIGITGLQYSSFVVGKRVPFHLNCHAYSCLLIDNKMPMRWRGRYNEDTDLCLQVLSSGLCIVTINAFSIQKMTTLTMKGGNTDELYKGDGRLKMARSLERVWPYISSTKRRFQRPQHVIRGNWSNFDTPLIRRKDIDWSKFPENDEYGMELKQVGEEIKSPRLRELLKQHQETYVKCKGDGSATP